MFGGFWGRNEAKRSHGLGIVFTEFSGSFGVILFSVRRVGGECLAVWSMVFPGSLCMRGRENGVWEVRELVIKLF